MVEGAKLLQFMRGVSEVKKWEVQPESAIAMKGHVGWEDQRQKQKNEW